MFPQPYPCKLRWITKTLKPKSLFVEEQHALHYFTINADLHGNDQRQLSAPVYKSPPQLLIDELEDDIRVKYVELESARDHLCHIQKRFSNYNVKINNTKFH